MGQNHSKQDLSVRLRILVSSVLRCRYMPCFLIKYSAWMYIVHLDCTQETLGSLIHAQKLSTVSYDSKAQY